MHRSPLTGTGWLYVQSSSSLAGWLAGSWLGCWLHMRHRATQGTHSQDLCEKCVYCDCEKSNSLSKQVYLANNSRVMIAYNKALMKGFWSWLTSKVATVWHAQKVDWQCYVVHISNIQLYLTSSLATCVISIMKIWNLENLVHALHVQRLAW